jgi:hypothetical protein
MEVEMGHDSVVSRVILELEEMGKLNIRPVSGAIDRARRDPEAVNEYRTNGMKISEIADLLCDLEGISA